MPARLATFASAIATAAAIVAIALIVGHPSPAVPEAAKAANPVAIPEEGSWAAAAAALPVTEGSATAPPYERDSFGDTAADTDGNGCSQRDDVLARDLADPVVENCTVVSGTLNDPYSGRKLGITTDRTAAGDDTDVTRVRVDHVVSLRAAHDGGAWRWSPERRAQFAGSLENMLTVDRDSAQEKGGRGPAKWLPSDDGFVCEYAIRYTWIATAWELAVPRADRDTLIATLNDCGR